MQFKPSSVKTGRGVNQPRPERAILSVSHSFWIENHDPDSYERWKAVRKSEQALQACLLREIFGNPFDPVTINPAWTTANVTALAQSVRESLGKLNGCTNLLIRQGVPNPPAARHSKQPQFPLGSLVAQKRQHRDRIVAPQPFGLGHRHRLIVAGPD
jgi:hypothetical protein